MHRGERCEQNQAAQMHDARDVVAAEGRGDPIQLDRFVDRQSRQNDDDTEQNRRRVCHALEAVVEILGRRSFADAEVVSEHRERVRSVAAWDENAAAPFAARDHIDEVDDAVEDEEPGDREMPVTRAREPSAETQPRRRRVVLKRIPAIQPAARAERRIRGENLEAAAGHDDEQRNVDPMREANRGRLCASCAAASFSGDCGGSLAPRRRESKRGRRSSGFSVLHRMRVHM